MIGNDIARSIEFVKSPSQAGQLAKALPFTLPMIIALYVLCAILTVLVSEALSMVMPDLMQDMVAPEGASVFEQQIYDVAKGYVVFFRSNPVLVAILMTIVKVISSVLLFVVGRNFMPKIDFLETQSALVRLEVVWTILAIIPQLIAIIFWSISETAGSGFANIVAIFGFVLFVLKLHVIKGIFGFDSFGKAALVWLLMLLSLIGVGFFLSLIITVITL